MVKRVPGLFIILSFILIILIFSINIVSALSIADFFKDLFTKEKPQPQYSAPSNIFSFAVLGDSRGANAGVSATLRILAGDIKNKNPDLVLFTGDLTKSGDGLNEWKNYMGTLFGKTFPQYGNHDTGSLTNWLSTFRASDASFQNLQSLGVQNYRELSGYEKRVYSFDYKNTHFISLNIVTTSLSQDQKTWLENDLINNRKEHNFVFWHIQAYSMDGHSPINTADRNFMFNLFFDYGVEAVFVGNEHLYGKYIVDGTQFGHSGKQIYQFISGGAGAPLYSCKSGLPANSVCEKTYNYEIINIDGSKVTVKSYRSDNSEIETIYISSLPGTLPPPNNITSPNVLSLSNRAICGSNNIPDTMYIEESRTVFIDLLNNGINSPWDSTITNPYRLGSQQPQDNSIWSIGRVDKVCNVDLSLCSSTPPVLLKPENNIPGATGWYRFWFNIKAPQTPGEYSSYWKMVQDGIEWFGETCGKNINVIQISAPAPTPPPNSQLKDDSNCGSNSIPTQMISGETKTIFIDLFNNGTTQWDSTLSVNPYRLGAVANNNRWGLIRVKTVCTQANPSQCSWQNAVLLTPSNHLPEPNVRYYRFYFNITAPQVNATTNFPSYWRMVQENVKWFGSTCGKNITVLAIATQVATQDTSPPQIIINNPQNTIYSINSVIFNISLNENGDSCKYTLNNWVNSIKMNKETNTRFSYVNSSIGEGSYTVKFSCNDTRGNINNTASISFSINLSTNSCTSVVCGTNAYCNSSAGNCVCNSAYKDCNNNISNGCEVLQTANCSQCTSGETRECLINQSSTRSCLNNTGCIGSQECNETGFWQECQQIGNDDDDNGDDDNLLNRTQNQTRQTTPECTSNSSCLENQFCKNNLCKDISCTGEIKNHSCIEKKSSNKYAILFYLLIFIIILAILIKLLLRKKIIQNSVKWNLIPQKK